MTYAQNCRLLGLFCVVLHICAACVAFGNLPTISPSEETWQSLNATLDGRLQQTSGPLALPCFALTTDVRPDLNAAQCATVMANYSNSTFRASKFGSYMNTEWETCQTTNAECLLDSSNTSDTAAFLPPRTCSMGSIPEYFIDVQDATDVRAAFQFSKKTGINLVVKNTGHDYKGRSSGPNTLALWTYNLQDVSYSPEFVPQGCQSSSALPAVTYGAGVTHGTLYEFANQMNITLPGGASTTVGAAGGYLQGGGHNPFANTFGLAVDRVLEFQLVTPDGNFTTANACQNTDLFFALRGGGGGTFGVVLQVTMKALPQIAPWTAAAAFNGTASNQKLFLTFMIENSLSYAEQGWGGYILPTEGIILTNPLVNASEAASNTESLKDLIVNQLGGTFTLSSDPSYLSFYNKYVATEEVPVGLPFIIVSRLIPADNFATPVKQQQLLDTIIPVIGNATLPIIFAVAPFYFESDGGTSVTEAWRTSLWHFTVANFWNFNTTVDEREEIYKNLTTSMDPLRAITTGSGAYQNEADVYEPDFEDSFWGENYSRLVAIKRKYDPDHLLDCWQCIDWKGANDSRYTCYIDPMMVQ